MKKYALWIGIAIVVTAVVVWRLWKKKHSVNSEIYPLGANNNSTSGLSYTPPFQNKFTADDWDANELVNLKKGSTGKAVKMLQYAINKTFPGKYNLQEDGILGTLTENAVIKIYSSTQAPLWAIFTNYPGFTTLKEMNQRIGIDGAFKKQFI